MLQTKNLTLLPFTRDMMLALLSDRAALKEHVSAHVPDTWPGPDLVEALPAFSSMMLDEGIWVYLIVHKQDNNIIGDIGASTAVSAKGAVEIGYSVVPEYQGRGYATEALAALAEWALQQPGVSRLIAECQAGNLASRRVLEKAGFLLVSESDGTLRWEKKG